LLGWHYFAQKKEMHLDLIIFDLAGTTVRDNRYVHKVLQRALLDEGVSISIEDANAVMGIPKPIAIKQLLAERYEGDKNIDEAFIEDIHQRFRHYMIEFYETSEEVQEKEGVSEVFSALRAKGIVVAVNTGFDRSITQPLLNKLGWIKNDLINFSITSDEVPRGRPFPDMIHKLMGMAGVQSAANVAKVGDTLSDLQEGTAAGCHWVIGITDGAFSLQQLTMGTSTHLIDNILEIKSMFDL
jgi:phosphonatase-like hydrolase